MSLVGLASQPARGTGVESFTGATIEVLPRGGGDPGIPPQPLDLDLRTIGGGLREFSIPPGGIARIRVTGIASGGGILTQLMDHDSLEAFRGFDDELDERFGVGEYLPGEEFTIDMYCSCDQNGSGVDGLEDSGEQTAELYIKDGEASIPQGPTEDGPRGFWQIDCDKDVTSMISPPDTVDTPWRDKLIVPVGAFGSPTNVRVANMFPLLNAHARPSGYLPISEALTIEPDGLTLGAPATLVFAYTQEEADEVADEHTLQVFRYDVGSGQWFLHGSAVVDADQHTLTSQITEFGTYGFAAQTPYLVPLASQQVATDFGDNTVGQSGLANGSELDNLSYVSTSTMLYLYLGGNLESNFNKLELFFDTGSGGQNRLRGNNPTVDFNGLNRMGDDGSGNGFTFDPDFDADYWIGLTGGDVGAGQYRLFANYATLPTDGGGVGYYLGEGRYAGDGLLEGGTNPFALRVRVNNLNTAGVPAGCSAASPSTVPTGIELGIPRAALGWPTGCIKVLAFVNGVSHDHVSNQFLGSLPAGTCNLGEPRLVNLGFPAGSQYVDLCLAPAVGVGDGTQPPGPRARAAVVVSPNPGRGSFSIRLWGVPPGPAHVAIHDMSGRLIRELGPEALSTGVATWDGLDDRGSPAAAGLYIVRVSGPGFELAAKAVRLR